jgi:spore maturation protein SpmA
MLLLTILKALVLGLRLMEAARKSGRIELIGELNREISSINKAKTPKERREIAYRITNLINKL